MFMHKLATEVLDFKDDDGALLKQIFSSYESIPECIKQANLSPPDNHQYALIDGEFKKFAMHDKGNTLLSLIYFSANKDKLPEDLRKEAAVEIATNLTRWSDPVPKELKDMADSLKSKGVEVVTRERNWKNPETLESVVDQKGNSYAGRELANKQDYKERDKEMESVFDRYNDTKEVTTKEASKGSYLLGEKFPINSFSDTKRASEYFLENWREFAPEERKEYCEKLAQRMEELGLKPEGDIARYGSTKYAEDVEVYTLSRKQFVLPEEHFILENLVEKIAQVEPRTYVEALKVFDKEFGLDRFWDSQLVDPYKSTFGPEKTAEEWRYNYRNVYISEENLNKLKLQDVEQVLGKDLAERFIFAPKKVFEKLPNDKKYVIARLAMQELPA
jgi:hypothetical protein